MLESKSIIMSPERRKLIIFGDKIKDITSINRAINVLENFLATTTPWSASEWADARKILVIAYELYGPELEFMCHQDHFHPEYVLWLNCIETTSTEIREFVIKTLELLRKL